MLWWVDPWPAIFNEPSHSCKINDLQSYKNNYSLLQLLLIHFLCLIGVLLKLLCHHILLNLEDIVKKKKKIYLNLT